MAWLTTTDKIRLRFADQGAKDAQTVVLLHEIGMCLETWDPLTQALESDYRVIRLDLRHHGLSQRLPGVPNMPDLVEDLKSLLHHCNVVDPVILCGAAVGGALSLSFAANHPEAVKGVIAASPATGVPPEARAQALAMADGIAQHGFSAVLGEKGIESLFPEEIRVNEALFQRFLDLSYIASNEVIANYLRMVAALDIGEQLSAIQRPVQLLGGRYDAMRPASVVEALATCIPGAAYTCIDSGHYASLQAPHALNHHIRSLA